MVMKARHWWRDGGNFGWSEKPNMACGDATVLTKAMDICWDSTGPAD
eukprot:CAMPEP_0172484274 /NCGR_PEP_ID=MMETSP1066-20121228/11659_1 /TAXON_ID=671091 /ORGANISM="Coscinodiscus wailesii, Strain CCMP2513" /LENGTH=46 /DNA_ID= /DNA_START= /DNA_END= /DNA_ORIENTATION=